MPRYTLEEARRLEAERQLAQAEEELPQVERLGASAPRYLSVILEHLDVGVLLIEGDDRRIVFANQAMAALAGLARSALLGMQREQFIDHLSARAQDPASVHRELGAIPLEGPYAAESLLTLARPTRRVVEWRARPVPLPNGTGQLCLYRDVTREIDSVQSLERLASTDALTGLANRRTGLEALARELVRAEATRAPLCVALFDLDHFKRINDTLGHGVGDDALTAAGRVLLQCSRRRDLAIRWGGEELLLLLPDCDLDGARRVAERVLELLRAVRHPGLAEGISASAGIARHHPPEGVDPLLRRADALLYRAKALGRSRVEVEPQAANGAMSGSL